MRLLLYSSYMLHAVRSDTASLHGDGVAFATGQFLKDHVPFGFSESCSMGQERVGYQISSDMLQERRLQLEPLPHNASFEEEGVELFDLREALEAVGVTENTYDITNPTHRQLVGHVLLEAASARFKKQAIHWVDTSRVSGGAAYGEATVRETKNGSSLRNAHYGFHVDAYLPGIAKLWGGSGRRFGTEAYVDWVHWRHMDADSKRLGFSKEEALNAVNEGSPGIAQFWISLTPGELKQSPLAVIDKRTFNLEDPDLSYISTHPVVFPALNATISLVRDRAVDGARFLWKPKMRFGEALLFSYLSTAHSAVRLEGDDLSGAWRSSAEMRILMV